LAITAPAPATPRPLTQRRDPLLGKAHCATNPTRCRRECPHYPDSDLLIGRLLPFLTYAVGFAARPLGALVFGHYGDRPGRMKLLVLSLLLTGGATFAIGLLPTQASVGRLLLSCSSRSGWSRR
jgi:MFS family permease